jgi:hypothetical protein
MQGRLPSQDDGGNDEALTPSNLANEATEEGLPSTVLPAKKPHPSATTLAVFEIAPDLAEFLCMPNGNALEALCGDKSTSQCSNNTFAALLVVLHL